LEFQKYNVKEKKKKERKKEKKKKKKKGHKNYRIYIYMKFALKKNRVFFFFCKVIVVYKSEN